MPTYQILADSNRDFEVIEYPTLGQEKAFNRLLAKSSDEVVPPQDKRDVCDKWGWYDEVEEEDGETERVYDDYITGEVITHGEYHLELAKVIFEDADDLSESDIDDLKPGLIQEARTDFIEGCQGRSDEQPGSSMQALLQMVRSLIGQNGATTETGSKATTAER